ncbi:class I SAM-dependent methyltransferase [Dactylosporangium sucinum]|uniref:S-adenosyl-L-methionine-dependent methyltransferase n=1 Tax=Dactylosporangium sucinum TaxID=1424081 RepID=A0A917WJW4_9ACTN|nr:class I SAM-dependent methyltransferase [Dactylosporangium sucinum]GGM09600.1 SAM-dependent methyltransferase [Dactylosporangium sucinum]
MEGSSRTAEHVALFRALETRRRNGRLFADPLAERMLPWRYRAFAVLSRLPAVHRGLVRYLDGRWPGGPRASAVVRTRLIDDHVTDAVAAGAAQLVLLGAGFDNRAYRLPLDVRRFEVDHPATQATKRRRVPPRLVAANAVRFVPADLARDDLATALRGGGFDPARPAVVVWEGVTNYLTATAVDATLRALAGLLAPGSRLVFTYVDRAVLDGTAAHAGADGWRRAVGRYGEPWTFGLDPAELAAYLAERGLSLRDDRSTRDAAERYLAPLGRDEPTAAFYRVAVAEVRGAEGR